MSCFKRTHREPVLTAVVSITNSDTFMRLEVLSSPLYREGENMQKVWNIFHQLQRRLDVELSGLVEDWLVLSQRLD